MKQPCINSRLFLLLCLVVCTSVVKLQAQSFSLRGQVLDSATHIPVSFASVQLVNNKILLKGTVADETGKFNFEKVEEKSATIKIDFAGYKTLLFTPDISSKNGEIILPAIYLAPRADLLSDVTVKGQTNTSSIRLDKQVVDAKKFQTAANGTGLELLQKMPSVTVSNEGEIALRGSTGFIVLINGKPSNRTPADILAQLPANAIDNVEIITSPSAKYDADGKAGIINIVLKKEVKSGWNFSGNGMFGGSSPLRFGGDLQVNYTAKKWSFYVSGDYRRFDIDGHRVGVVRTIVNDTLTYFPSDGIRNYRDYQYAVRAGASFAIDINNSINVAFYKGKKQTDRTADLYYSQYTKTGAGALLFGENFAGPPQQIFNKNLFVRSGDFTTANTDYTHIFKNKSKLSLLAQYEYSVLGGPLVNSDEPIGQSPWFEERSTERSPLHGIRLQTDYAVQLSKDIKLETGYQWRNLNEKGFFNYLRRDTATNGQWFKDPAFNDDLVLTQQIQAGYVQLSGQQKALSYTIGLRTEAMNRELKDLLNPAPFKYRTLNFFPSAQALWSLGKSNKIRLGYSRRIDWPSAKLLSPFQNHRHKETIEIGDPNLKPEIADVLELSFTKAWKKGSFTATIFYNNVKDKVLRVNAIYAPTILLRTYTNAGNASSAGSELSADVSITNWWKFYASVSVYHFNVNGNFKGLTTQTSSINYNGNANTTISITPLLKFQWDVTYVSPSVTTQGRDGHYMLSNAGLKYAFSNNKTTLGLQLNNIFNTNIQTIQTAQADFYSSTDYIKYDRVLQLSVGFRINDGGKKQKAVKTEYGEKDF